VFIIQFCLFVCDSLSEMYVGIFISYVYISALILFVGHPEGHLESWP